MKIIFFTASFGMITKIRLLSWKHSLTFVFFQVLSYTLDDVIYPYLIDEPKESWLYTLTCCIIAKTNHNCKQLDLPTKISQNSHYRAMIDKKSFKVTQESKLVWKYKKNLKKAIFKTLKEFFFFCLTWSLDWDILQRF